MSAVSMDGRSRTGGQLEDAGNRWIHTKEGRRPAKVGGQADERRMRAAGRDNWIDGRGRASGPLEGAGKQQTVETAEWELDIESVEGTEGPDSVRAQRLFLKSILHSENRIAMVFRPL